MNETILAIDLGSSTINAVIAKKTINNNINILGVGIHESKGIKKGLIVNIEEASKAIKNTILIAKRTAIDEQINTCVISISGAYCKSLTSTGAINIPNGSVISEKEISRALKTAHYNASIVSEYKAVHIIPTSFKIDDSMDVKNPLGLNASRLEVSTFIVTAKNSALNNIRSTLKSINIDCKIQFVLDSYATATSTLNNQQKKHGSIAINVGSSTTEFICFKSNSPIFNGFIPVGSDNVTNDLSEMIHTPSIAAEALKTDYGSLIKNFSDENSLGVKKVKVPRIDDETAKVEVSLDRVQTIIHARVEEIFVLIKNNLKKNGILDNIGSGIVITGGLSNLEGVKKLAELIYEGIPISLTSPENIENRYINFQNPSMATLMGLILYSIGFSTRNYQLDSNETLLQPTKENSIPEVKMNNLNNNINFNRNNFQNDNINKTQNRQREYETENNRKANEEPTILTPLNKNKKKGFLGRIFDKITESF